MSVPSKVHTVQLVKIQGLTATSRLQRSPLRRLGWGRARLTLWL